MSGFAAPSLSQPQADQILATIRYTLRIVLTSASRVEPGSVRTASLLPMAAPNQEPEWESLT